MLSVAVLLRALMSWFPIDPNNPVAELLVQITEPILQPLRQIIPRLGMIDLTPMAAIILLQVLNGIVAGGVG